MKTPIVPEIAALRESMETWRHHLHAHPETAFAEVGTSAYIAEQLRAFGIEEIHTGLAKTGIVALIPGKQPGPWIGLRADIDALDVQEDNDLPYRSVYPGKMHACGHDGHTAMLLGAGKYLAATRNFAGTVALIFQPAEENEGGGRLMVEEGLFSRFPIASVFGLHNQPDMPLGHFAIQAGPQMAAYDIFEIVLTGFGSHAGKPNLGNDTIVAAAHLVTALQTITSRNVDPLDPLVLSITQIHGGDTWNVLPQQVVLRGTVRSFSTAVQAMVQQRMGALVHSLEPGFGVRGTVRYERRYPAMVNATGPTQTAIAAASAVVGPEQVDVNPQPVMGSEDFAFMLQVCPGAYIRLGAGPGCVQHNPAYRFNDDILTTGAAYWVALVEQVLGKIV